MATQLREANQLAIPSNQEGQLNWFPVGMGGKQLIFISVFFDFERIERCFYQLQKNSVFINLYPLHLTDSQESTLKGKNITVHNFTSVFENNWVLPMGTEAENADVIIDVKAKQLSFKGVAISLAPREFKTVVLILKQAPSPFSQNDFNQDYHQTANKEGIPDLPKVISTINSKIKAQTGIHPFLSQKGKRGLGYVMASELKTTIIQ